MSVTSINSDTRLSGRCPAAQLKLGVDWARLRDFHDSLAHNQSEPKFHGSFKPHLDNRNSGKSASTVPAAKRDITAKRIDVPSRPMLDEWHERFEVTSLHFLESGNVRTILEQWKSRPRQLDIQAPDIVLRALGDMGDYRSPLFFTDDLLDRFDQCADMRRVTRLRFQATAADFIPLLAARVRNQNHRLRFSSIVKRLILDTTTLAPRDFDALIAASSLLKIRPAEDDGEKVAAKAKELQQHSVRAALSALLFNGGSEFAAAANQLAVAQWAYDPSPPGF